MGEPTMIGLHACGSTLLRAQLRRAGERIEVLGLERKPFATRMTPADAKNPDSPSQQHADPSSPRTQTSQDVTANSVAYVAAMPGPDVMTRCWAFPEADDARSRQMVANRLEAELPTSMDELVWGYRRGSQVSSREPTTHVLAQAARHDRISRHIETLSGDGIEVDTLTTEAEALAALYRHGLETDGTDGPDVLVLAGDDEWLVAVLAGGVVRLVQRVAMTAAGLDAACRECRQCMEADQPAQKFHRVLWCATPSMAEARHALAETLGIDVEPVGARRSLVAPGGTRLSGDRLVEFGPAIGLALAGLLERNEVIRFAGRQDEAAQPGHARIERLLSHPWRWTALAAGLLITAFVIHVGALHWESNRMSALLEDRDESDSAMTALEPKIRAMLRLERWRIDAEGIVAAICPHVPNDMIISSIRMSRERGFTIKGTVGDLKKAFALGEELRKNTQRFADVQIGRTEPAKGGSFTITADLVGVESLASAGTRGGQWP